MDVKTVLKRRIDEVNKYLSKHLPLANCHMVEFITEDHWNKYIPPEIILETNENDYDRVIECFWGINKSTHLFNNILKFINDTNEHCLMESEFCISDDCLKEKLNYNIESIKINDFMCNKKSHEAKKMSSIIATLCQWSNTLYVIDMGGGKGYVSAMLAMQYNIPVLNVDSSEDNIKGALKRKNHLKKFWQGIMNNCKKDPENIIKMQALDIKIDNMKSYKEIVQHVKEDTDLVKLIKENFVVENPNICITGLHTCGSLGPNSLKLFTRLSSATTLCTVPCCYNLINEADTTVENTDFPLSEYLKGNFIGKNARMLAAQSRDRVKALKQIPCSSIFYRALFQKLLNDNGLTKGKMGKSTKDHSRFSEYVKTALTTFKPEFDCINYDDEYLDNLESEHAQNKKHLNVFYLLRMCLAPVIENLILLDRLMYLYENGFDGQSGEAFLVKIFDPITSPRHVSLIAYRHIK